MVPKKKLPQPMEPRRPSKAEEGMPRTDPPVGADDYDASEQPNQPDELSVRQMGEVTHGRVAAKKATPKKAVE